MKERQKKRSIFSWKFFWIAFVFGIIVLGVEYVGLTGYDNRTAQNVLEKSISIVKKTLKRYDNMILNDQTKSLIRLLDKTSELSRVYNQEKGFDHNRLNEYVQEQRLDGAMILDHKGRIVMQSSIGSKGCYTLWKDVINDENVNDVLKYSKKSYISRIRRKNAEYDFVATSTKRAHGMVVSYKKAGTSSESSSEITLASLFEECNLKLDGTVVITNGKKVLSTNNRRLKKQTMKFCKALHENSHNKNEISMTKLVAKTKVWYGSGSRLKNYHIYVFFPGRSMYKNRRTVIAYSMAVLGVFLLIVLLLYQHFLKGNFDEIQKQYRIISAVNSIYVINLLIHLKEKKWESIKISERFKQSVHLDLDCSVDELVRALCTVFVVDSQKEEFTDFLDIHTMEQRIGEQPYISKWFEGKDKNWYLSIAIPQHYDKNGKLISIILLFRNVTAEKKREFTYQEQLRKSMEQEKRANNAKTDFLRRMSHDIRTPINGIRGMVEISRHYIGNKEKQEDCRNKIMDASGFLLDLVNNVLDMNKLESGAIRLENKSFCLQQMVREIKPMLDIRAREYGVRIEWEKIPEEIPYLVGSPLHLQQILQNIIGNALKYNKENGLVEVKWNFEQKNADKLIVILICKDTGRGMSKEFQKKALEPFTQEDAAAHAAYTGTGLGLSIVKELVEQMEGTMHFESEVDAGTTFWISIPLQVDHSNVQKMIETLPEGRKLLEGYHILLAEDNELNMEIVEFMLEKEGASITKAWNGKEAVDLFRASKEDTFDLILMDIMMPVMNGLEATQCIRFMDRKDAKEISIIAMTANAFSDDVERSYEAGLNEHLAKPLDRNKLVAAILKAQVHKWFNTGNQ